MITVITERGNVIQYHTWPAMRDDRSLADDEPLKAMYIEFDIILKSRNHIVMTQKPASGRDEIGQLDTTIDEWRAAVQPLPDDPGFTIDELVQKLNIPRTTLNGRIVELLVTGKCVQGRATRKDRLDRPYHVTVYQLIGEEK